MAPIGAGRFLPTRRATAALARRGCGTLLFSSAVPGDLPWYILTPRPHQLAWPTFPPSSRNDSLPRSHSLTTVSPVGLCRGEAPRLHSEFSTLPA